MPPETCPLPAASPWGRRAGCPARRTGFRVGFRDGGEPRSLPPEPSFPPADHGQAAPGRRLRAWPQPTLLAPPGTRVCQRVGARGEAPWEGRGPQQPRHGGRRGTTPPAPLPSRGSCPRRAFCTLLLRLAARRGCFQDVAVPPLRLAGGGTAPEELPRERPAPLQHPAPPQAANPRKIPRVFVRRRPQEAAPRWAAAAVAFLQVPSVAMGLVCFSLPFNGFSAPLLMNEFTAPLLRQPRAMLPGAARCRESRSQTQTAASKESSLVLGPFGAN